MARMLPPYIDKTCKSKAEEKIFNFLKDSDFTSEWTVLHSLNLSEHVKRLYGEIDLLLMIPGKGVYVMEVKGGGVKRKDGRWYYINRFGKEFKSNVGPFNQARDAMFSLKSAIAKNFGKDHRLSKILTGFFCAFPDVRFTQTSIEYEEWQVFDKGSLASDPKHFFDSLAMEFYNKFKDQKWFSEEESIPTIEDINTLCSFLRGDFERVRTVQDQLEDFGKRVKSYTQEQFRILDSIHLNPRCLIQGSAGTGKTMIAIESAIRSASNGKSVFLTCFNKLISEWVQQQIVGWEERIKVVNLHSYLFEVSKGFDYDKDQLDNESFYSEYLPDLISEFFKKGILKKYDKIIVDEGQDLLRPNYLKLFDSMLNNGLIDGHWEVYCDFERQAIYSQLSKLEMVKILENYSRPTNFLLTINCRNTKQIGEETSLISGFDKPPFLLEYLEGIPVQYFFYNGIFHQQELIRNVIKKLKEDGLSDNEVKILSGRKLVNSVANNIDGIRIRELRSVSDFYNKGHYGFATVHSFKGLESNYIIITDIEDLTKEQSRSLLYVGMSRAKYGLILFISDNMQNTYKSLLKLKINAT